MMIYFDNAATSYPKPQSVYNAIINNLKYEGGNPGRSSHRLSALASEKIYITRESLCNMLNIENPERVVFTYNATESLNLAIKTRICEKCHILVSDLEHNSVIRPLHALKNRLGVEYSSYCTDGDIEKSIKENVRPDTKGIVSTLMSNVTGKELDISILSRVAAELGLFLILDASQILGHRKIDLSGIHFDALCGPGHKGLLGISGIGFTIFGDKKRRNSFIDGGSGSDSLSPVMPIYLPDGYEAGTPGVPAIAALAAGIKHVRSVGEDEIGYRLDRLTKLCSDRLSSVNGLKLHSADNGILCFNLLDIPSTALSSMLDGYGIATRGGFHCAPSAHKKLGTLLVGTVRVSFSYKNTVRELDRLYKVLQNISFVS